MTRAIRPAGAVRASITVPGSKSITNRALLCAALARGTSCISGASDSDDSTLLANGLNQLGVLARRSGDAFIVEGTGGRIFGPKYPIPVGNAGTTTRFLAALGAVAAGRVVLRLDSRMTERPMEELLEVLGALGVPASLQRHAELLTVEGTGLNGGEVSVRADRSSQFLSALLLVAPCAGSPLRIRVEGGVVSEPYVEMTLAVMRSFGVAVECAGGVYEVPQGMTYVPGGFAVEADASSASSFLAAALITGGVVEVPGLVRDGLQPDAGFVDVLERMGAVASWTASGVRLAGAGPVRGVDVDMNRMPDAVPALAVTALFADGPTHIRNVGHLRFKESDRLEALTSELRAAGADIRCEGEDLIITPSGLHGATLDPRGDHRLAMSFALIGLRIPGIMIADPGCVSKSFPRFWEELANIQG